VHERRPVWARLAVYGGLVVGIMMLPRRVVEHNRHRLILIECEGGTRNCAAHDCLTGGILRSSVPGKYGLGSRAGSLKGSPAGETLKRSALRSAAARSSAGNPVYAGP